MGAPDAPGGLTPSAEEEPVPGTVIGVVFAASART